MTQICSHRTEKGASGVHEGAGGPASGQGTGEGRGGSGWKRRAAPETHTFRCHQVGSEQPLVVSDQGGTTAQWSFEMVKMVKVKMTVAAGGGGRQGCRRGTTEEATAVVLIEETEAEPQRWRGGTACVRPPTGPMEQSCPKRPTPRTPRGITQWGVREAGYWEKPGGPAQQGSGSLNSTPADPSTTASCRCCCCSVAQSYLTLCDPMDCSSLPPRIFSNSCPLS